MVTKIIILMITTLLLRFSFCSTWSVMPYHQFWNLDTFTSCWFTSWSGHVLTRLCFQRTVITREREIIWSRYFYFANAYSTTSLLSWFSMKFSILASIKLAVNRLGSEWPIFRDIYNLCMQARDEKVRLSNADCFNLLRRTNCRVNVYRFHFILPSKSCTSAFGLFWIFPFSEPLRRPGCCFTVNAI